MEGDPSLLIDRDGAADALRFYTDRLCEVLRGAQDREAPAVGSWTVGDVANHAVWGIENYTRWLRGEDAPDLESIRDMARWNIETVRRLPRANLVELADRLHGSTESFVDAARAIPSSAEVRWYAGNRIPIQVAISMRLIEAGIHGFDIARAAGTPWRIRPADARIMAYGLGYVAHHFVDDRKLDFDGTLRLRLRGGADLYYGIEDRTLRVTTHGSRPGWTLSVEPVSWVLVATGRRSQWAAALRGKIVGWGRSPMLPFKLRAASLQG